MKVIKAVAKPKPVQLKVKVMRDESYAIAQPKAVINFPGLALTKT